MKAPTRVRDMADGTSRYRWVETGPLEHYRHAQAYDHIAAEITIFKSDTLSVGVYRGVLGRVVVVG